VIFPHAAARSKKRSVGRHPPLRLETSLRCFRVATTRSPGFPLDFLQYPIDFPSEEREKGGGAEESTQTAPIRKLPVPFSLSLAGEEGVEKKIEFQLDPRGEQGRFVRVNPFMAGAQWRDGNRFENKSKGALKSEKNRKETKKKSRFAKGVQQAARTFPGKKSAMFLNDDAAFRTRFLK